MLSMVLGTQNSIHADHYEFHDLNPQGQFSMYRRNKYIFEVIIIISTNYLLALSAWGGGMFLDFIFKHPLETSGNINWAHNGDDLHL